MSTERTQTTPGPIRGQDATRLTTAPNVTTERTPTTEDALRVALARNIGKSGWVRLTGEPPDHDRAWLRMLCEADGIIEDADFHAAILAIEAEARASLVEALRRLRDEADPVWAAYVSDMPIDRTQTGLAEALRLADDVLSREEPTP